jgi:hypothetical protein
MARGNAYGIPLIVTANTTGAKKVEKSLKNLIKQTKSFGLTSKLSIGAASVALTAFAKKSVAAALADEKAQKSLTQTLKNLGLAYNTVGVTNYIDSLQRATGVSEDELRPAFQKLVLVLGDVGKAQSALSLAMDISAGTGKDLSAVSMALAKGYSGQTTALSRLGAGLSKTLLKSGDMEAITAQLSKLFAGQAQAAVKTYSGQMAILTVSAKEASETIGFALVDSLAKLSGDQGVKGLAMQMESLAQSNADVLIGFTDILAKFKIMKDAKPSKGSILDLIPIIGPSLTNLLGSRGQRVRESKTARTEANPFDRGLNNRALNLATKIVAKKKEAAKIDKAAAANTKLQGMFDIDAIQIAAALKGKISELDRKSLEAMQALKTADKNDDISALKELEQAKINADAADRARKIKALQDTINFNKAALDDWQANFDKMNSNTTKMLGLSAAAYSVGAPGSTQQTGIQQAQSDLFKGTLPDLSYLTFDLAALGAANAQMNAGIAAQQAANVTVNLQGGINIGSTLEFYQTVQAAVQEATRNGWSLAGTATG